MIFTKHPARNIQQASTAAPTAEASPWVYANVSFLPQLVTVSGGVVSTIEIDSGAGYALSGLLSGLFAMLAGDDMRIVYVVTPPTLSAVTLGT